MHNDFHERCVEGQEQIEALGSEHEKLIQLCENRKLDPVAFVEDEAQNSRLKSRYISNFSISHK